MRNPLLIFKLAFLHERVPVKLMMKEKNVLSTLYNIMMLIIS